MWSMRLFVAVGVLPLRQAREPGRRRSGCNAVRPRLPYGNGRLAEDLDLPAARC